MLANGLQALTSVMPATSKLNDALPDPGSSVLLRELSVARSPVDAVNDSYETPILHGIVSIHSMVTMFINVCRTGQVILMSLLF